MTRSLPKLTLAERFLLTRRRMGVTQMELARIMGVCDRTVRKLERGLGPVRKSTLERFMILESRHK